MSMFYNGKQDRENENMGAAYPHLDAPQYKGKKQDTIFKRAQENKQAPESMGNLRKSVLLKNQEGEEPSWCTRCCACTKLEYYKDYFEVANKDVIERMLKSLQFWVGGFFEPKEQVYDFYGPFWIITTIVFCLGAVHNIINYQAQDPFQYDFGVVGSAFGFMYIEGFGFPILFTFLLKFLGAECTHIQIICIYGYSLVPAIVCLLLCSLNVCILHVILIAYAMGSKAAFLIKNINQIEMSSQKRIIGVGVIIAEAVLQFFVFKFAFIICASAPAHAASTPAHAASAHHLTQHLRIRWFEV